MNYGKDQSIKNIGLLLLLTAFLQFSCTNEKSPAKDLFVKVENGGFVREGKPYFFMGANYWQGMNLGSMLAGGDKERMKKELDQMQSIGITNLRILAVSEGPEDGIYRIHPFLQDSTGKLNEELLKGLDALLDEMGKRNMTAIVVLNNFWPWSGGMAQYVSWHTKTPIDYPPLEGGGSWDPYQKYAARFYTIPEAVAQYHRVTEQIVNRKNSISNILYKDDPTIMAWELANEPRGINQVDAFQVWIDSTASLLKKWDPKHLVTTGAEGYTPGPAFAGTDFKKMHGGRNIDYTTAHIWIQNWAWYDPKKHDSTYPAAVDSMKAYLMLHAEESKQLGKPFVLEEFGIMKDSGQFDPAATTLHRDAYYRTVFEDVYQLALKGKASGVNFWAWAGQGRPVKPGTMWKKGDPFTGDPPHEPQGWYSVYDRDTATHRVIREYADKLASVANKK